MDVQETPLIESVDYGETRRSLDEALVALEAARLELAKAEASAPCAEKRPSRTTNWIGPVTAGIGVLSAAVLGGGAVPIGLVGGVLLGVLATLHPGKHGLGRAFVVASIATLFVVVATWSQPSDLLRVFASAIAFLVVGVACASVSGRLREKASDADQAVRVRVAQAHVQQYADEVRRFRDALKRAQEAGLGALPGLAVAYDGNDFNHFWRRT